MHAPDEMTLFASRLDAVGAPYMITGATAAIIYGQPRLTNDLDVVLALADEQVRALQAAFPETEFYIPPESVIRTEQARALRGHFNLIHHESGYKADVYLVGQDPLHAWAMPLRRSIEWTVDMVLWVAPPEYVILRKLEFFREGRSHKHPTDIRAILATTSVDRATIDSWLPRLGLVEVWAEVVHG
ncbi:MAG: hypothetical protein IAE82_18015 [Opitutaceae bacterium]|nr:hypothetical protein [Opitutaceae bacterium]